MRQRLDSRHRDGKEGIKTVGEADTCCFHQQKEVEWAGQCVISILLKGLVKHSSQVGSGNDGLLGLAVACTYCQAHQVIDELGIFNVDGLAVLGQANLVMYGTLY